MKLLFGRLSALLTGHSRFGPYLFLLTVVLAVFANALAGEFVWDDQIYLLNKPAYQNFDLHRILLSLANDLEYLPVRDLSYALDWAIWGRRAFGFHLTSLIIFAATVLLIHHLTERLAVLLHPQQEPSRARKTGLLCALLFAVHPIHVEVVSFITGRNALLAGAFSLLCCGAFLNSITQAQQAKRQVLLALFWFLLALFSKATSITLPLVLIFLVMLMRPPSWRTAMMQIVPFLVLAVGSFALFRAIAARSFLLPTEQNSFTLAYLTQKLALAVQIPFFYLGKMLLPLGLTPEYTIDFPVSLSSPEVICALLALAGSLTGAYVFRHRQPLMVFGFGWYLLTLLPVLHIFPTYPTVADRYAYFPSFGICLMVAAGVTNLASTKWRKPVIFGTAGIILVLALIAGQQNMIWRSGETLWRHTISVSPGSVKAYSNLGRIHFTAGRYEEAFACFDQARTLAPADPHFDFFTGLRYFIRGEHAQALPHFNRAEARDTDFLETLFHTAMAHEALGNHDMAVAYFTRTVQSIQDDLGSFKSTAREHLQRINSR